MKPTRIIKVQKGDGEWVEVRFHVGDGWYPSFEELGRMLKLIGECEDDKYQYGKGAEMVTEFCKDAIIGFPYEELRKKYQLPK